MSKCDHRSVFLHRSHIRTILVWRRKISFSSMIKSLLFMTEWETSLILNDCLQFCRVRSRSWWTNFSSRLRSSRDHTDFWSFLSKILLDTVSSWAWGQFLPIRVLSSVIFSKLRSSLIYSGFVHFISTRARHIRCRFGKLSSSIFRDDPEFITPVSFLIVSARSRGKIWDSFRSFSSKAILDLWKRLS